MTGLRKKEKKGGKEGGETDDLSYIHSTFYLSHGDIIIARWRAYVSSQISSGK